LVQIVDSSRSANVADLATILVSNSSTGQVGADQPAAAKALFHLLLMALAKRFVPGICEKLPSNRLSADAATLGELPVVIVLAVWLSVVLKKIVIGKWLTTNRTNEMLAVPTTAESLHVLASNRLAAAFAARAKRLVIISLAVRLFVLFKKLLMV